MGRDVFVKGDLRVVYIASLVVALLMAFASLAGLVYRAALYPEETRLVFAGQDALNLAIELPLLLVSLWLARGGKLNGLLFLPGMLFSVAYVYFPYLLGLPLNALFLVYAALAALSIFTLAGLLAGIDHQAVRRRLVEVVPARTSGGILLALALLVIVRQAALIVAALANHTPVDTLTVATWIVDLTMQCPALLVSGVLLWRREALGYVAGAGLLLQYGVLAVGVIPILALQARAGSTSLNPADILILLFMAGICFAPLSFFIRRGSSKDEVAL